MTNRAGRRRRHRRHKARTARGPYRNDYPGPHTLVSWLLLEEDPRVAKWRAGKWPTWVSTRRRYDAVAELLAATNPILLDAVFAPVEQEPLTYRPACPRPPCQSPLP